MGNEDPELEKAYRAWLATRPKTVPASSKRVLERAERRLLGAIKHGEPREKLVVNAERVRQAQLCCFKAKDLVAELPTDVDGEQMRRHRDNLARAKATWDRMSVDDIIALYSQQVGKP
jgi:hypothetical protein